MNPIHSLFPLLLTVFTLCACGQEPAGGPSPAPSHVPGQAAVPTALMGHWLGTGDDHERLEFRADGTLLADDVPLPCKVRGEELLLEVQGQRIGATWGVEGEELTITLRRADGSVAVERYRRVTAPVATEARERLGALSFVLPPTWRVANRDGDVALINPGLAATDTLDALIVVAVTPVEAAARARSAAALLQSQLPRIGADLGGQQVEVDLARAVAQPMRSPGLDAAELQVRGRAGGQRAVTVWLGAAKGEAFAATVLVVVLKGREAAFLPGARQLLGSAQFGAAAPAAVRGAGEELAGLEFGHASFGSGSSLTTVYRFGTGGSAQRRTMFSSSLGGTDSEAGGTFELRGDRVVIRIGDDVVEAQIERRSGAAIALRIGNAVYRRS
ncbi:MAG: hypothetical protein H6838_19265 [Planctomycetes bacterium]|nr:hypothetical protein [Planctomycetota bacterium]MCB9887640.1 hypothetical protein [Planctomycetota bacterium]